MKYHKDILTPLLTYLLRNKMLRDRQSIKEQNKVVNLLWSVDFEKLLLVKNYLQIYIFLCLYYLSIIFSKIYIFMRYLLCSSVTSRNHCCFFFPCDSVTGLYRKNLRTYLIHERNIGHEYMKAHTQRKRKRERKEEQRRKEKEVVVKHAVRL